MHISLTLKNLTPLFCPQASVPPGQVNTNQMGQPQGVANKVVAWTGVLEWQEVTQNRGIFSLLYFFLTLQISCSLFLPIPCLGAVKKSLQHPKK